MLERVGGSTLGILWYSRDMVMTLKHMTAEMAKSKYLLDTRPCTHKRGLE